MTETTRPVDATSNHDASPEEMLRQNLSAFMHTKGKGIIVRPCLVNGVRTAVAFAKLRQRIEATRDANGKLQVQWALTPLFIQPPDEGFKIEILPDETKGDEILEQEVINEDQMVTRFDTEGNA